MAYFMDKHQVNVPQENYIEAISRENETQVHKWIMKAATKRLLEYKTTIEEDTELL